MPGPSPDSTTRFTALPERFDDETMRVRLSFDRIEVACSGEWLRLVSRWLRWSQWSGIMRISVLLFSGNIIFSCLCTAYGLCLKCAVGVCACEELIQPMVRGAKLLNRAFVKLSWCHLRHSSADVLGVQASSTLDGLPCRGVVGFLLHLTE